MRKSILLITILILLTLGLRAQFAGGNGSAKYPFQVATAAQLDEVRNYTSSTYNFIVTADINLTTYLASGGAGWTKWGTLGWLPIGTNANPFNANFNGQGFEITGLSFSRSGENYLGLFGSIGADGDVSDLGVGSNKSFLLKGENYIGVLCGSLNSGSISDCYVVGNIAGQNYLGGLTGTNSSGTIQNCKANSDVTGNFHIGAFAGYNKSGGTITNSFAEGSVTASNDAGGFTGYNSESTISDCYSYATVSQPTNTNPILAGFAGINHKGVITNCYSTGWVKFSGTVQTNKGFCSFTDTGSGYEMSGNFWDTTTSGATSTAGIATGKTTILMKTCGTFTAAGWDFMDETTNGSDDFWGINSDENNGYPFLEWQGYENNPMFLNGDGTDANPFQITTSEELNNVRNFLGDTHSDKHFTVMNDIDLTDYLATGDGHTAWGAAGWLPIGDFDSGNAFKGEFNGLGNKITGLWINRPGEDYVALFSYVSGGEIKNLGVETDESSLILGKQCVSVLVGTNIGTIENCNAKGDIESTEMTFSYAGTIAGANGGNIRYCYANGTVTGGGYIGGLLGFNNFDGSINNSYSLVNVTLRSEAADTTAGGCVGRNYGGKVINNYSTGWVKYGDEIQTNKGFIGSVNNSGDDYEMTGNYWDTETSGAPSTGGTVNEYASGKTTFEMKKQSTFAGWNFAGTWSIISGSVISYPYLTNNAQNPEPGVDYLFGGGNGDSDKPYRISTAKQLNNVRYFIGPDYASVFFELYNDIDLTDYLASGEGYTKWGLNGWLPIGTFVPFDNTQRFYGKFQGNGNKITGLWIDRQGTYGVGLFGCVEEEGRIEDMGVEICDTSFVSGDNGVGGLVGMLQSNASVTNCYSRGLINGLNQAGGLVGDNYGIIVNSYADAGVYRISGGGICFGGFSGTNYHGKIINCYSKGWVRKSSGLPFDGKGFCGSIDEGGDFEMSGNFWDMQTSGSTTSACNATGKTSAEMKTYSTFFDAGWDFMDETENGKEDIWGINHASNSGYPFLYWQGYENNPANELRDNLQMCDLNITGTEPVCFNARDTITVAGGGTTVVVGSTSSVELIAGQSIRFLPGFHAIEGSFVNASITTDGTFCNPTAPAIVLNPQTVKSLEVSPDPEVKSIVGTEKSIKVYPNPNNGQFTVELKNFENATQLMIYNSMGQRVYNVTVTGQQHLVSLPNLQRGIYFLKAVHNEKQFDQKILVK